MMKTTLACIAGAALFAIGGNAHAQISYNYLEAGYQFSTTTIQDVEIDGNGIRAGLSYSPINNFFGFLDADWASLDTDEDASVFDLTAGVGIYYPVASAVDLVGRAAWKFSSFDISDVSGFDDLDDDNGVTFDVGVRAMVGPTFELGAFVGWESVGDLGDGAVIDAYGLFHVNRQLGIGAAAAFGDDADGFRAFLRYNF